MLLKSLPRASQANHGGMRGSADLVIADQRRRVISKCASDNSLQTISPNSFLLTKPLPDIQMAAFIPSSAPWTSPSFPRHSVHPMSIPMLEALELGDLETASSLAPAHLPQFLISKSCRWIWRRHLSMVAADPEHDSWKGRLIVFEAVRDDDPNQAAGISAPEAEEKLTKIIVGRIGLHSKPDDSGLVEVGYEIDPAYRRRGHAKAALRIMIELARGLPSISVLRASVSPENLASRTVVESQGLRKVGRVVHERRGVEDVFLLDVSSVKRFLDPISSKTSLIEKTKR